MTYDMCFGNVGEKWQNLASCTVYLAVIANFLALDDDEHGPEYALIPVTSAWFHFILHVLFGVGISLNKSKLYFPKHSWPEVI